MASERTARSGMAEMPEALMAECYADMRRIARGLMARDGMARFLQPTELVNEAAIRSVPDDVLNRDALTRAWSWIRRHWMGDIP